MLNTTSSFNSAEDIANRNDTTAALLEELEDIIEDIDFAHIFVKFGGTKCLMQTAKEKEGSGLSEANRSTCLSIIGSLSQNNITVQDILVKDGIMPVLMAFRVQVGSSSSSSGITRSSDKIWSKALYALGSIVKNHAAAEVLFLQHYAVDAFSNLGDANVLSNAVKRRCVYLALFLVGQDVSRVASLINLFIPALYQFVKDPNDPDLREGSLQLLANFARTAQGKQMMEGHIERVLEERDGILVFDDDYDQTQEKQLVENLHIALAADPEDNHAGITGEETTPTPSVLMLEAPKLNAASRAP